MLVDEWAKAKGSSPLFYLGGYLPKRDKPDELQNSSYPLFPFRGEL